MPRHFEHPPNTQHIKNADIPRNFVNLKLRTPETYVLVGHFAYASKRTVVPEPVTPRTFEEPSTDATNVDIMQTSIGGAEVRWFPSAVSALPRREDHHIRRLKQDVSVRQSLRSPMTFHFLDSPEISWICIISCTQKIQRSLS
jgi:hypothetical protein